MQIIEEQATTKTLLFMTTQQCYVIRLGFALAKRWLVEHMEVGVGARGSLPDDTRTKRITTVSVRTLS